MIVFEITDTGPGIPSEKLHKLFSPFQKHKLGLGLTVSHGLVRALNYSKKKGEIRVSSIFGQGSKFTFPVTYSENNNFTELNEVIRAPQRPFSFVFKTILNQKKEN